MKYKYIVTTGLGILITGGFYFGPDDPSHEPVKIVRDTTTDRTRDIISPFGAPTLFDIPQNIPSIPGDTFKSLQDFLDQNSILKQRIQGMSWYRDFISGNMPILTAKQYIQDAFGIEQQLIQHPGLLSKIQYESWWQRYTRGDTNPTDMLNGNIASYLQLQQIGKEKPELYNMASMSPLWNSGIQQGEDYIVVGQHEIITSFSLRLKFLDENPEIEKKIQEQGFTVNG